MGMSQMRHMLTLQRRETVDDGGGGEVESWVDAGNPLIWAEIRPAAPRLRREHATRTAEISYRILTRYRPDIGLDHRLVEEESGRIFEITGVIDPEARKRVTEIHAIEALPTD